MKKNAIRDYFSFSRDQRRGLFILGIFILLCKLCPLLFPYIYPRQTAESKTFQESVAAFLSRQSKSKSHIDTPVTYFSFDPNKLSVSGWQKLGLSQHTITTIQHYLAAGGHFYKKKDLKKIYGLSKKTYHILAPYITIAQPKEKKSKKSTRKMPHYQSKKNKLQPTPFLSTYHKKRVIIDINKADSTTWTRLYGIGPVLSARIVRFRNALGGFCSIHQISEVYGLPDSTFQSIKNQLNISTVSLKKLNINKASVDKLKSHPYINYRLARSIKAFRDMHGSYDSLAGLKQLQLVDDQIYRKLVPYLSVK